MILRLKRKIKWNKGETRSTLIDITEGLRLKPEGVIEVRVNALRKKRLFWDENSQLA
jgi:hypothetical protein